MTNEITLNESKIRDLVFTTKTLAHDAHSLLCKAHTLAYILPTDEQSEALRQRLSEITDELSEMLDKEASDLFDEYYN